MGVSALVAISLAALTPSISDSTFELDLSLFTSATRKRCMSMCLGSSRLNDCGVPLDGQPGEHVDRASRCEIVDPRRRVRA